MHTFCIESLIELRRYSDQVLSITDFGASDSSDNVINRHQAEHNAVEVMYFKTACRACDNRIRARFIDHGRAADQIDSFHVHALRVAFSDAITSEEFT